ncbi:MAG: 3-oxoacyl-[acyl-carrier-protein] synthase III C-terminal domain-containing protein [Chloroflexota bacterium]
MSENNNIIGTSFFNRPNVRVDNINVAGGIPFGIESVTNSSINIGGAYCAWGKSFDNDQLPAFVGMRMHEEFSKEESMNLSELGFVSRHHIPDLSDDEHLELELEVGTRLLKEAIIANHWAADEIEGVLIGTSAPVSLDYAEEISRRAGIKKDALIVSVHKACDGSMGALHLALNPRLSTPSGFNIANKLAGKKVLVGGIEGLSRFTSHARDKNALQLFGNGAGVIGVIPGVTMKFLAGKSFENYDEEGLLQVRMFYPHARKADVNHSMLEIQEYAPNRLRIAGLMHEPEGGYPIVMAGLMGMVKLFVRSGVSVVTEVMAEYTSLMEKIGTPERKIDIGIVHHANYKINLLKAKQLLKEGIDYPMPWLLNDFGNVSAASCMIAFLRQLNSLKPGEHVMFDGFGAGTYYDVMAIELG